MIRKVLNCIILLLLLLCCNLTNNVNVENNVSFNYVETEQIAEGNKTIDGYDTLKTNLKDEIVPQAVSAIISTYDDTFGYLMGSNIGIGLEIINDSSTKMLACVKQAVGYSTSLLKTTYNLTFTLSVNVASLSFDSIGNLNLQSRCDLEQTISHEMMHALMFETLTCGMNGRNEDNKDVDPFPLWFIEGTAQTTGGGLDWVKSIGINSLTPELMVKGILNKNDLNSESNAAYYATGYLATLYLGYLIDNKKSFDEKDIANGIDILLTDIRKGLSLDNAIKKNTNNQYQTALEFSTNFAADGSKFVVSLLDDIYSSGNGGYGSLITNDFNDADLLEDQDRDHHIFDLDIINEQVKNKYPKDYPVMSGGSLKIDNSDKENDPARRYPGILPVPKPDPKPDPEPIPDPEPTPDPEPEPEPEPKPDPEPTPDPEPEPEPEPKPDPEPDPEPEPEPKPEPEPEPEPDPEPDPNPDINSNNNGKVNYIFNPWYLLFIVLGIIGLYIVISVIKHAIKK